MHHVQLSMCITCSCLSRVSTWFTSFGPPELSKSCWIWLGHCIHPHLHTGPARMHAPCRHTLTRYQPRSTFDTMITKTMTKQYLIKMVLHGESNTSQASPRMTIQRMCQPQEAVQP